jgi:hypothetical protein
MTEIDLHLLAKWSNGYMMYLHDKAPDSWVEMFKTLYDLGAIKQEGRGETQWTLVE